MLGIMILMLSAGAIANDTNEVLQNSSLISVADFSTGVIKGLGTQVGVEEFVSCSTHSF
jgi:hypothetical protein